MKNIREVNYSDAQALQRINQLSLRYDFPLADAQKYLFLLLDLEKEKIFVFEQDQIVVGYIQMSEYITTYTPKMINILALAVHPDYQSQGIGKQLMEQAEKWAKLVDAEGIRLSSGAERKEAHLFYERIGFKKVKEQKTIEPAW